MVISVCTVTHSVKWVGLFMDGMSNRSVVSVMNVLQVIVSVGVMDVLEQVMDVRSVVMSVKH